MIEHPDLGLVRVATLDHLNAPGNLERRVNVQECALLAEQPLYGFILRCCPDINRAPRAKTCSATAGRPAQKPVMNVAIACVPSRLIASHQRRARKDIYSVSLPISTLRPFDNTFRAAYAESTGRDGE